MSKGKEFYEYCKTKPEIMEKLRSMKTEEIMKYVGSMGFELDTKEIRRFMELCAQSNDEQLAAAVSGGNCAGHCGRTCESQDSICNFDGPV